MKAPKINVGTWTRTIVLLVTLINQILAVSGASPLPFGEQEINDVMVSIDMLVSTGALIVASVVAWWKDNDITKNARAKKEENAN